MSDMVGKRFVADTGRWKGQTCIVTAVDDTTVFYARAIERWRDDVEGIAALVDAYEAKRKAQAGQGGES